MRDSNNFGKNVRKRRMQLKLSQKYVAEKSDTSQSLYSNYENGKLLPGLYNAVKIAETLDISLDELCRG